MPDEHEPDAKERKQFEDSLMSIETVQDALRVLGKPFRIITLDSLNARAEYGYRQIARFKDGDALSFDRRFPNGTGTEYEYFLHRHGESLIYELGGIGVRNANPTNRGGPKGLFLSSI